MTKKFGNGGSVSHGFKAAYSIAEFCMAYGISRSNFYLKKPPDRPRTVVLGRRRLILLTSIQEWEARMLANDNPSDGRSQGDAVNTDFND